MSGVRGQVAVDQLVKLLDLEQLEKYIFRGRAAKVSLQRVFGGQVAAQALTAAGRSVDSERHVHSLHSYFIRPGASDLPIIYMVDPVRDGRSFSVRRVTALQNGKTIFYLSASFQIHEEGLEHADQIPEGLPSPEQLPTLHSYFSRSEIQGPSPMWEHLPWPMDLRYLGTPGWSKQRHPTEHQRVWMRSDGVLPDDPLIHTCVMVFASDITLLDAVLARHGEVWGPGGFRGASLDHALWFHRSFRADEWMLYDMESPTASGARGLATGRFFSHDGSYLASVVQEGLLRR